jgi:hypothetical protein
MAAAFALASVATFLFAQQTQPLDNAANNDAQMVAAENSSATGTTDSLFAEINRGFAALEPIFVKGCFDCHTDRTRYPWYHKLPLVGSMIDGDIRKARRNLDMASGFPFSRKGNVADDLVAMRDELQSGDMPPLNYRFMHWDAKPSHSEKDSVINWIDLSLKALAAQGIEPSAPPESDSDTDDE